MTSKKYFSRKGKIEVTIKNDTKLSKITAFSTIVLVLITIFYAYQTFRLSNISFEQVILSAEPNIDLESEAFNKSKSGNVVFQLVNLSPVDLKNIRLYSKYYTHLIDKDLNEFTLLRGIKAILPDFEIERIEGNNGIHIEFDFKRSGLATKVRDDIHYFIGTPPNVKRYSIRDINKFPNVTFAEYRIDFQRKIDGKEFSRTFYYIITASTKPQERMFVRKTKEEIINLNRDTARLVRMVERSAKKKPKSKK